MFESLRERLLKGGIAPRRVRRYLAELEDHLVELTRCEEDAGYDSAEAAIRARAALGEDALLAEAMLSQPRLRSLTARAPWLVFGILPPFIVLGGFFVMVLTMIAIAKGLHMMAGDAPAWYRHLVLGAAFVSTLLLPGMAAAYVTGLAIRQRSTTLWPLLSMAIILLLGVQWHAGFATPGHHGGYMSVGLLVFASQQAKLEWQLGLAQAFLTVSPMIWWTAWRKRATV